MTLQRISKNMVSHRLFFHIVQTQTSYTDITTRRISHTSIARTTMLCPFALATCRGVWQSSFVTNAFAENSKEKKKHSLKLNYQRHKNKNKNYTAASTWNFQNDSKIRQYTSPPRERSNFTVFSRPLFAAWCKGVPALRPATQ
jgi:hypothetical protein